MLYTGEVMLLWDSESTLHLDQHYQNLYDTPLPPKHGRRLSGTEGDGPPKFEVGDGPCICAPNISRSTVIGCEAKYELTKKRSRGGILYSEIDVFGQEKGHIIMCVC